MQMKTLRQSENGLWLALHELLKVNPRPVVVRDNRNGSEPITLTTSYTQRDLQRIADANTALTAMGERRMK